MSKRVWSERGRSYDDCRTVKKHRQEEALDIGLAMHEQRVSEIS